MDNPGADVMETSTLLEDADKKSKGLHLRKLVLELEIAEAEKRLKNLERVYLCASEKHDELKWLGRHFYSEEIRARSCFSYIGYHIDQFKHLVEEFQNTLDKVTKARPKQNGTEAIHHHSLHAFALHGCKNLAQENKQLQRKAQHQKPENDEPSQEEISFEYINRELNYIQRTFPRGSGKHSMHELLKEAKETRKLRDNAIANGRHDILAKSMENEIKVLEKMVGELQKDRTESVHRMQESRRAYEDFAKKAKALEEKKERQCGRWDEENKHIIGLKKTLGRVVTSLTRLERKNMNML
ncbi:PREDICTED: uncharacterized protein LOC104804690 [Tarenaya hassleriana]|uniref:uncharacterized protein LOC104804690 n=1 Tax=Tarenaya hassleriana TaxID=28532 RepID=UPI00053C6CB2|nr:PREDICTED: uncharacterized protein LOC104804690 [Tarenaya hassleriana]